MDPTLPVPAQRLPSPSATPKARYLLELVTMMLGQLGDSGLSAASPMDALNAVATRGSDSHLFITDVVMPEMNGRDLADRLQKVRPGIRHLFMSPDLAGAVMCFIMFTTPGDAGTDVCFLACDQ